MNVRELVEAYIEDIKLSLSESTIRSRRYRLRALENNMEPKELYSKLKKEGKKPYGIKTLFIEASKFYDWQIASGYCEINPFRNFLTKHANLFKHAYEKEKLSVTFEEAFTKINSIGRGEVRQKALQLLLGGLRFTESLTLTDGQVLGKGGRKRTAFLPESLQDIHFSTSYATFRRELAKVGLKPHTLRKLAATKLVDGGLGVHDLMEVMGWSNIQTSASYVQAKNEDKLRSLTQEILQGAI